MNWSSASEFFAMGGYGFYVWGSFGMTALVMLGELIALRLRRQALLRAVREGQDEPSPTHFSEAPHEA
ncbi:MAG: heme exporter protein CcmD [Bacteriovorax sp.]|nr:heme exporter protein CcmD [Rhizobacter sp.]